MPPPHILILKLSWAQGLGYGTESLYALPMALWIVPALPEREHPTFELAERETKAQGSCLLLHVTPQAGDRSSSAAFTQSHPIAHLRRRFWVWFKTRASPREHVYPWPPAKGRFHSLPASAVRGNVSKRDQSRITECSS